MTHRVREAGDAALVLEFEVRIDPMINAKAIAVAEAIRAAGHPGVRDVVSSYSAVTVCFDPLQADPEQLAAALEQGADQIEPEVRASAPPISVPVCYGGDCGPDLQEVATFAGCSPEEVIRLHAAPVYRVYMLGFVPGFPYLGTVDARIAMPRRATPRLHVPAGSVGIAGSQTGIYPMGTPGGWRVIGRTPLKPFDPRQPDPFVFKPGDAVRFELISEAMLRERDGSRDRTSAD